MKIRMWLPVAFVALFPITFPTIGCESGGGNVSQMIRIDHGFSFRMDAVQAGETARVCLPMYNGTLQTSGRAAPAVSTFEIVTDWFEVSKMVDGAISHFWHVEKGLLEINSPCEPEIKQANAFRVLLRMPLLRAEFMVYENPTLRGCWGGYLVGGTRWERGELTGWKMGNISNCIPSKRACIPYPSVVYHLLYSYCQDVLDNITDAFDFSLSEMASTHLFTWKALCVVIVAVVVVAVVIFLAPEIGAVIVRAAAVVGRAVVIIGMVGISTKTVSALAEKIDNMITTEVEAPSLVEDAMQPLTPVSSPVSTSNPPSPVNTSDVSSPSETGNSPNQSEDVDLVNVVEHFFRTSDDADKNDRYKVQFVIRNDGKRSAHLKYQITLYRADRFVTDVGGYNYLKSGMRKTLSLYVVPKTMGQDNGTKVLWHAQLYVFDENTGEELLANAVRRRIRRND